MPAESLSQRSAENEGRRWEYYDPLFSEWVKSPPAPYAYAYAATADAIDLLSVQLFCNP